jgi:hypothetical protein
MGTGIILAKNRDIAEVKFGDFSTFGDIGPALKKKKLKKGCTLPSL